METDLFFQENCTQYLLVNDDCMTAMHRIPNKSIDLILCDLPYGTTQNYWDKPLPLEDYVRLDSFVFNEAEYLLYAYSNGETYQQARMFWKKNKLPGLWSHYKRIIKDRGCIALFCQVPFDSQLMASNFGMLKYEWIIEKTKATGFLNAKKAPLKAHEKVLIFYKKAPVYNPQMIAGHTPVHKYTKRTGDGNCYGKTSLTSGGGSTLRYPRDVLRYKWDTQKSKLHETQKPIKLLEYLIKTYTNEGAIVLDNCMGSGSTGVAAMECGRKFIGIEIDEEVFSVAENRIQDVFRNISAKEIKGVLT